MVNQEFIDCRNFHITLIEATSLDNVRKVFKMEVYAKVSLSVKSRTEKRCKADKHGLTNPAWNQSMKYTLAEAGVQNSSLMLIIKLYCKRALGDRYIGQVHTPIRDLFNYAHPHGGSAVLTLPVTKGSATTNGQLTFSYKFGEVIRVKMLPWWKRALRSGVSVFLRVMLVASVGIDVEIEIPIFPEPDIVDADA